jgi:hypothetical protein
MRAFITITFLLTSAMSFGAECEQLSAKAISCYEKGFLNYSYDETGEECGQNHNIWDIHPSENKSLRIEILSDALISYMGGNSWESVCAVAFQNQQGETCSFYLNASIGTEDAQLNILDFSCM